MKKAIDVNERTLEQEKKDFTLVCKVFEALCIAMLAVFAVLVLIVVGVSIPIGADWIDIMVFSANGAVLLVGNACALNFGRAIFKTLKSGETPFRYDIADKVKGAAFALMVCGFLSICFLGLSTSISEAFNDICHYFFFIAIGSCFTGLLLGIMSYVMGYGCKLQQESDETV